MQPRDIIKMPLNVNYDRIISQLKYISIYKNAAFEEVIKNSQQISKHLKNQKELEKRNKEYFINNEQKDIQQNQSMEYTQSIEQENFQQKDRIKNLEIQVEQLKRDIKNLNEETALKTQVFQNELSQRFTDSKQMPFTRITIPRSVQQYYYVQDQDILVQCEKDEPIPLLKLFNIEKRLLANNIYSNSVGQSFSCVSVFEDRLIWSTENSTEVEIWTFKQPPEPLKRIGIIPAHTDTVVNLQFLSKNIFFSTSQKGVVKLWRTDTQQLLKSFRFNSYITRTYLLNYRVITNINQSNDNSESIQIIAGFSDGFVRILEFQNISQDQAANIKCEVIYEVNINSQNNKDAGVDCISVAIPNDIQQQNAKVSINQITIAASITSEPDNIYIINPEKKKVHNILEFTKKFYRNSNSKKQFTLTKEYLIAGSFDGQIFIWDIKLLTHPLRANTPSLSLKLCPHTLLAVPILMAAYDQSRDTLITGDEQGNVLKWENFIQNVDKK